MHQNASLSDKKSKNFLPRPLPDWGGAYPLPRPHAPRRLWRLVKAPGFRRSCSFSFITRTLMIINSKKTKEMILGTADKSPPPLLTISNNPIQRVTCFKLLGINLGNDLRWDAHVDALCSKVASRLYFLKLLFKNVLGCQPMIYCVSINQLFILFWRMVQLYGIITLHTLKVINSKPSKNVRSA